MAASTELTWERGYNAVTVDAICERAGVKKGSFYHFFESKAALAIASMENAWQTRSRPNLDAAFSVSNPPLERLRRYFETLYQSQLEMSKAQGQVLGCPFFSLGMESGGLDPEVWHASQQYVKRKHRYLESAIREAQSAGQVDVSSVEEAVQGLLTLVEGAMARSRVQGNPEPLRGVYEQALRLLGAKRTATQT